MILRFILWSIVITFVLRFIFRFLLPVVSMTRAAQDKLHQMQQQMEDMQQKQQQTPPASKKANKIDGDYIDYEEVK